ncbi:uncharacterized protein TNCV_4013911 [Trichonephila clavipes]|nr:uncharacterized protein TNCV_4013911 [Trichonephila clavipes]
METYEFFSIQLDESTDSVDTAQLAISVKMVFDDFSTKEEFLKILPVTARTQGKDIFSLFEKFAIENKLSLQKLSSITTDGARATTGAKKNSPGMKTWVYWYLPIHPSSDVFTISNKCAYRNMKSSVRWSTVVQSLRTSLERLQYVMAVTMLPRTELSLSTAESLSPSEEPFALRFTDVLRKH